MFLNLDDFSIINLDEILFIYTEINNGDKDECCTLNLFTKNKTHRMVTFLLTNQEKTNIKVKSTLEYLENILPNNFVRINNYFINTNNTVTIDFNYCEDEDTDEIIDNDINIYFNHDFIVHKLKDSENYLNQSDFSKSNPYSDWLPLSFKTYDQGRNFMDKILSSLDECV